MVCEEPLLTIDRQVGLNVIHPEGKVHLPSGSDSRESKVEVRRSFVACKDLFQKDDIRPRDKFFYCSLSVSLLGFNVHPLKISLYSFRPSDHGSIASNSCSPTVLRLPDPQRRHLL